MNLLPLYGYVLRVISLVFTFFDIWCGGLCMAGVLCFLEYVACIFLCGNYLLWAVELWLVIHGVRKA